MKGQNKYLLIALIALVVAIGAFTSVRAAEDKTFRVVNYSSRDVLVEIYSTPSIVNGYGNHDTDDEGVIKIFIVPAGGSSEVLLDKDETYYYAYLACGTEIVDAGFKMDENIELLIYPCGRSHTTMEVRNHTNETITLILIGLDEEDYTIEPGLNRINVISGENVYSYEACNPILEFGGVIDIDPNGITDLLIRSCEYYDSLVFEYGAENVVSFRIINHASFPMILSVVGPMSDLIEISPGVNRVTLVAGSYTYSYYMDHELISSSFFVDPNGNGMLLLSPEYTISTGFVEEEVEEFE